MGQSRYIYTRFKKSKQILKDILQYIRPFPSRTYNSFNNKWTKHITRSHLGLSHLYVHKLKHSLLNSVIPIFSCGLDVEMACHYLLQCHNLTSQRSIFLNTVSRVNKDISASCGATVVKLLRHGDAGLVTNALILNAFVDYILSIKRFDGALM